MTNTKNNQEQELFDDGIIVACAPYKFTHVYVLVEFAEEDEDNEWGPDTNLLVYRFSDRRWSLVDEFDQAKFEDMAFTPDGHLLLMGACGQMFSLKHFDGELQLPNTEENDLPESRYVEMSNVGSNLYAVGITRTIVQYQEKNQWHVIGQATHTSDMQQKHNLQMGFECLGGFDENDIYASGYSADTWHYNGDTWRRVEIPTNLTMRTLLCTPNGQVYLAGKLGSLIKGRNDHWEIIESEFLNEYKLLGNLTWFKGCVYFTADGTELFRIDENESLKPAYEIAPLAGYTAGVIKANEDLMVVCGIRTVRIYNGEDWRVLAEY